MLPFALSTGRRAGKIRSEACHARFLSTVAVVFLGAGSGVLGQSGPTVPPPNPVPDVTTADLAAQPRSLQGHHQGLTAVRRSAPGHRAQSQGGRLDRGAAEELWLSDRSASNTPTPRRLRSADRSARPQAPSRIASGRIEHLWRRAAARPARAHRRQHRSDAAARRETPSAERRAGQRRSPRRSVLHQGRHASTRTRCTSSALTWMATAGARPPTTMDRARRS